MKEFSAVAAMATGLGIHPNRFMPRFKNSVRDRDKLSAETISDIKDAADLKRQRKHAKRVRDVLCGGWAASGYTAPYNRRVNLSARKG